MHIIRCYPALTRRFRDNALIREFLLLHEHPVLFHRLPGVVPMMGHSVSLVYVVLVRTTEVGVSVVPVLVFAVVETNRGSDCG